MGIFRMYTGNDGESIIEELQQDNPILETLKTCTGCSWRFLSQTKNGSRAIASHRRQAGNGRIKGILGVGRMTHGGKTGA